MKKFMRTRAPSRPPSPLRHPGPPATPAPPALAPYAAHNGNGKLNGHANGAAVPTSLRDDLRSTISRSSVGVGAGAPWEDPEFPAEWRRVGDRRVSAAEVVWKRPHELSSQAYYLDEEGADPDDVTSAHIGDRWGWWDGGAVAAAAGALATCPRLLRRVLVTSRARGGGALRDRRRYTGAFTFMLWEWGAWREVTVDDRLPIRRGLLMTSQHLYMHDYTLPLLEKACAKLYGSYGALRIGGVPRALQDLTGGIVQSFPLACVRGGGGSGGGASGEGGATLAFHVLNSAVPRSTLLVTYIETEKEGLWRVLPHGLVSGLAYTVTGLARVRGTVPLVRLRGRGVVGGWGGPWSRGSPEWNALTDRDRDLLADNTHHPDEFWMSFASFSRTFSCMCLVHVPPDDWVQEPALRTRRPWRAVLARRRWVPGHNAGGAPHCAETSSANPQFHLSVPREETRGGGGGEAEGKCHVVVAVCQQYRAAGDDAALLEVGFAVYSVEESSPRNTPLQLSGARPLDVTHGGRAREVATFFTLPAGEYVVVPHTRRAGCRGGFLLRVLTDRHTTVWEVNEDNVLVRDVAAEFLQHELSSLPVPPEMKTHFAKFYGNQDPDEMDVDGLVRVLRSGVGRRMLRGEGGGGGRGGPSRELARSLLALGGRAVLTQSHLPRLLHLLAYWRHVYLKHAAPAGRGGCAGRWGGCTRGLYWWETRAVLWAAGVTCSNKVLESVATRYTRRHEGSPHRLTLEDLIIVLARIHLAHYRYRSLEAKLKSNPLSLEEMILMTIYS